MIRITNNGVCTQRYNKRHSCDGHLFSGRYKSIVVESASPKDGPEMAIRQAVHSPLLEGISLDKAGSVVCNMNLSGAESTEQVRVAFESLQKECPEADLVTHTHIDEKGKTVATLIVGNFREARGTVRG